MYSKKLEDDAEKVDQDYGRLYRNMMKEYQYAATERSGHRYFLLLWNMVAPKGNIYRRNGLLAEHRKHTEDLWAQMYELADRHCDLLGGPGLPQEERADRLYQALTETRISGVPMPDRGAPLVKDSELPARLAVGFLPMEEFLREKVRRLGPFLFDHETEGTREGEAKHVLMGVGIFFLQVIAPLLIFLNRWTSRKNYMQSWKVLRHHMTPEQLFCAGSNVHEVLTTCMGVLLLFVIIFMVHCYVKEELDHAGKSSKLPTDRTWFMAGIFANAWGCVLIVFNIPLLFWSEPTPTAIVLDSMTLLFLFKLDDLSDILCSYMNMTDEDYQRLAAWNAALLSQCPVAVEDLINPGAKSLDQLWSVAYNQSGRLSRAGTGGEPCATRLTHQFTDEADESTPIVGNESSDKHHAGEKILYRPNRTEVKVLPTWLSKAVVWMWHLISWHLAVFQFLIPICWYLINKTCR